MMIPTARFGMVRIDPQRILTFPSGLPGFARLHRFALLWADAREIFWWMQAIEDPQVAFLVSDPALWVPDYEVAIDAAAQRVLGLADREDAAVLAVVSRQAERLTANLRSPLVINPAAGRAIQWLPAESPWSLQHELVRFAEPALAGVR